MSDNQSVLDDLTQGVDGAGPDADGERLRRAQESAQRASDRADAVYQSWTGMEDPDPRQSAVTRLLVDHAGSMTATVSDPDFLTAVRTDIGTQPYYVEETEIAGGEVTQPAHVHDPLDGDRAEVRRTLAALNEAEEHVGLPATSARDLLVRAGMTQSQASEAAQDALSPQTGWSVPQDREATAPKHTHRREPAGLQRGEGRQRFQNALSELKTLNAAKKAPTLHHDHDDYQHNLRAEGPSLGR